MSIDWNHFTPLKSLLGGILIGLSAGIFVLLNGRIAGISGIVGGLLRVKVGDINWRLAFIGGLILAPLTLLPLLAPITPKIDAGYLQLIIAGLLVGFGTRYGSGCTSGHGVCGLSRLSIRSLVATLIFMTTGVITVFVLRHLLI